MVGAPDDKGLGGQPTFQGFYRETFPVVARALGVTLNDHDLGTEAAAEAMARAYSRWAKVGSYDNPAGWVYRVGLNWALSLKRRLRRRVRPDRPTTVSLGPVADPGIHDALIALPWISDRWSCVGCCWTGQHIEPQTCSVSQRER